METVLAVRKTLSGKREKKVLQQGVQGEISQSLEVLQKDAAGC